MDGQTFRSGQAAIKTGQTEDVHNFGPKRSRSWRKDPDILAEHTLVPRPKDDYKDAAAVLDTQRGPLQVEAWVRARGPTDKSPLQPRRRESGE